MFDHLPVPPADRQFYSLGTLCQTLQMIPPAVLSLAASVGVEPHEYRDGVPVFRGDGVQRICDHINAARDKAAAAASN